MRKMTKQEFLAGLREKLSGLPREDIEERLNFYSEIIDDRTEEGLSEEEAVSALGDSDEIAAQILAEIKPAQAESKKTNPKKTWSALEIVLIVLGFPLWFPLLIAAFSVIFAAYIVIWSVIISFWAVFGSLAGCAFGGIAAGIIFIFGENVTAGIAVIGVGITLTGLSVFAFLGCRAATKFIFEFTKKITLWVKGFFVKKEKA